MFSQLWWNLSTYNWTCTSTVWICLNVHRCEKWCRTLWSVPPMILSEWLDPGITVITVHVPRLWLRCCDNKTVGCVSFDCNAHVDPHAARLNQRCSPTSVSLICQHRSSTRCPKIHWFWSSCSTLKTDTIWNNLGKDVPHFGRKADEAITINPLQQVLVGSRIVLEMISKREWSLLGTDSLG